MIETYRETALSVLSDLSSEILRRSRRDGDAEVSEDEAQRLYNATRAALDLGATTDQIAAALSGGFAEGQR